MKKLKTHSKNNSSWWFVTAMLILGCSIISGLCVEGDFSYCGDNSTDPSTWQGTCDPTGCSGACTRTVNMKASCQSTLSPDYCIPNTSGGGTSPTMTYPGTCVLKHGLGGACACNTGNSAGVPGVGIPGCFDNL